MVVNQCVNYFGNRKIMVLFVKGSWNFFFYYFVETKPIS